MLGPISRILLRVVVGILVVGKFGEHFDGRGILEAAHQRRTAISPGDERVDGHRAARLWGGSVFDVFPWPRTAREDSQQQGERTKKGTKAAPVSYQQECSLDPDPRRELALTWRLPRLPGRCRQITTAHGRLREFVVQAQEQSRFP